MHANHCMRPKNLNEKEKKMIKTVKLKYDCFRTELWNDTQDQGIDLGLFKTMVNPAALMLLRSAAALQCGMLSPYRPQ